MKADGTVLSGRLPGGEDKQKMEITEGEREGGREASWCLVMLQASVSTETTDWMNRKQGTGRRVCPTDMIPVLILLD